MRFSISRSGIAQKFLSKLDTGWKTPVTRPCISLKCKTGLILEKTILSGFRMTTEGTLIVKREPLIAKVENVSDRDAGTAKSKRSPIRTFEDLDVWKVCRDLRRQIAEIARG